MNDHRIDSEELEKEGMLDLERKRTGKYRKKSDTASDSEEAEVALLKLYLEELKAVPPVGELMKKELFQAASDGKEEARKRLAEAYLLSAVQTAAAYCGQGIGFADLVQEANVGLMEAMLNDKITEKSILESIEAALKRALAKERQEAKTREQTAALLNRMSDAAAELAKQHGREASVEELAVYLGRTVDEVQRGMKLSLEAIHFGD